MDVNANNDVDDFVIIVENEAESLPAEDERTKQQSTFELMDTCPICKLSFNNREPKLLPCLHSFCKRCVPAPYRNADPRQDSISQVDINKACKNCAFYLSLTWSQGELIWAPVASYNNCTNTISVIFAHNPHKTHHIVPLIQGDYN